MIHHPSPLNRPLLYGSAIPPFSPGQPVHVKHAGPGVVLKCIRSSRWTSGWIVSVRFADGTQGGCLSQFVTEEGSR